MTSETVGAAVAQRTSAGAGHVSHLCGKLQDPFPRLGVDVLFSIQSPGDAGLGQADTLGDVVDRRPLIHCLSSSHHPIAGAVTGPGTGYGHIVPCPGRLSMVVPKAGRSTSLELRDLTHVG